MKSTTEVVAFIEEITMASTSATNMDIIELGSLSDLLPIEVAERLREAFVASSTQVRQLTNQTDLGEWTDVAGMPQLVEVRTVSPEVLHIQTEVLVFADTVAWYRLGEQPDCGVVRDQGYADTVRSLFESVWQSATPYKA